MGVVAQASNLHLGNRGRVVTSSESSSATYCLPKTLEVKHENLHFITFNSKEQFTIERYLIEWAGGIAQPLFISNK